MGRDAQERDLRAGSARGDQRGVARPAEAIVLFGVLAAWFGVLAAWFGVLAAWFGVLAAWFGVLAAWFGVLAA
jgi:hypothetical protein